MNPLFCDNCYKHFENEKPAVTDTVGSIQLYFCSEKCYNEFMDKLRKHRDLNYMEF